MNRVAAPAALVMVTAITATADGQWPRTPPKDTNWIDTITVGRLETGGCEWSAVSRRMRAGKRGTTTMAGLARERTCTVLIYNVTTGADNDMPAVVGFGYVQDHKSTLPKNTVLNFADTFTVARRADGNCDWGKTPFRPGKKGSSSFLGEARTKDCWGVVYNVTSPPQDLTGIKSDTLTAIPTDNGPAFVRADEVVAAVRRLYPRSDTVRVTNVRVKGDSAWATVHDRPGGATFVTLVREHGRWSVTKRAAR